MEYYIINQDIIKNSKKWNAIFNEQNDFANIMAYPCADDFLVSIREIEVGQRNLDKLVHFITYGITATLILMVLSERGSRFRHLLSILLSSLYGLFTEIIQSLLPYRSFSIEDIAADIIGATIFTVLWKVFFCRSENSLRMEDYHFAKFIIGGNYLKLLW